MPTAKLLAPLALVLFGCDRTMPPVADKIADGPALNAVAPATAPASAQHRALAAPQAPQLSALSASPPSPDLPTLSPPGSKLNDDAIHFAVIGDYGLSGPGEASVAALVKGWKPDFIVTTGDNNYPAGGADTIDQNIGQYFHEFISPYVGSAGQGASENRFFPCLGNHDWYTPDALPYLSYFTLPGNERYYDFVKGSVHFFAVDSDEHEPDGIDKNSRQALWLKSRLAKSSARWQVVYFHHAPFSSGSFHGSTVIMQWPFEEWGVDLVLTGHEHFYERLQERGIPYVTIGLGGNAPYDFAAPLPGSIVRVRGGTGALRVVANNQRLVSEFVTTDDKVVDTLDLH
ncbi:MAG TPA: metallophosphoesterase [Polyangiaceae bacterium]|nr:metallophosphoesterase [Polyangiaceae bacterium]